MVVLDGHTMLGTGPNQYLQPDYLSPLPTTLDAKKSPLALLAQTCSQIGADSPNTKSLLPSLETTKRKSSTSSESSGSLTFSSGPEPKSSHDRERESAGSRPRSNGGAVPSTTPVTKSSASSSSSGGKSSPAFKPYESVPVAASKSSREESGKSPQSHHEKSRTPAKRAASSSPNAEPLPAKHPRKSPQAAGEPNTKKSGSSSNSEDGKSSPKVNHNEQGSSPIIRSGLEVLHGHGLGKPGSSALSSLSALASHYPPGFDPSNPAMRPPFFAPPSAHHFLGAGYPPSGLSAPGGSPYVSYTRVKTPSGGETIVPVCKDPYCTGCSLSMPGLMANAAAFAAAAGFPGFMGPGVPSGGICPAGCAQCDHQKFSFPGFMPPPGMGMPPTSSAGYPASLLSQHAQAQAQAAAAAAQHQQQSSQRPYVCSWIVGDSYCGKRFPSSEELLQHLRSHPNVMTSEASALSAMTSPGSIYSSALLSSQMSAAAAAMHRTYPTPPLSPLSAARYNPFGPAGGKPGGAFGGIPTSLSSLVPHPQSLANYYSSMAPYGLYGQRIGPPVHP